MPEGVDWDWTASTNNGWQPLEGEVVGWLASCMFHVAELLMGDGTEKEESLEKSTFCCVDGRVYELVRNIPMEGSRCPNEKGDMGDWHARCEFSLGGSRFTVGNEMLW